MNRSFSSALKGERQCKQREQNEHREVKQSCVLEEEQEVSYGWSVRGTGDMTTGTLQGIQGLRHLAPGKGWATACHTCPLGSGVLPVKTCTLQSHPSPGL